MTDSEHNDPLRRWLADDPFVLNAVVLVAASSLAIALTSCLWHHIHPVDQQHPNNPPSIFSAALSSFYISAARTLPSTTQQQSLSIPPSGLAAEQNDHKGTRSKERRRRGKDPFRDLLKGGKKSKTLLKAVKAADHDLDHDHDYPPPSADTLSNASVPGNDSPSASCTSRSQSPEPARDPLDPAESDDSSSVKDTIPNDDTSSTSAVASSGDISDHSASGACSHADCIRPHSCPPDSMTATDTELNVSSASTVIGHVPEVALSSPPVSVACRDISTPPPRDSQAAFTSGSCANLVRVRTRLRASKLDPSVKSSPSSTADSVASSFPSMHSIVPCPSLSIVVSTNHSIDGAGPSTPTNSRESTPPRSLSPSEDPGNGEPNTQPLDESVVTAQTQLASMRGALEAARLREEQLRVEAEQASKERDELCWRWNEDAGVWRRREAELQAQVHHLVQQLQAYAAVASFQVQQGLNSPSPTSPHAHSSPRLQHHALTPFPHPPAFQTQNSASAPAHVQALLTSHPPGFAAPAPGGLYPGAGFGISPLLWSGMGLCVPNRDPRHGGRRTSDSSASGSSPRGRRRRRRTEDVKSASDESSLGDWDGSGDEEDSWEEEEEEDIFRNNALADAILKRPESIRGLSGSVRKRSGMGRGGVHGTERMDALKDPALEKHGFVLPLVDTPAVTQ